MGVERFLITAAVNGVLSQRLIRKLCSDCKNPLELTDEVITSMGIAPFMVGGNQTIYEPVGCETCKGTGYRGRMAIFEIMTLDDHLRSLIMGDASTAALRVEARKRGMRTLRETGLLAIYEGQTTIDEVVRETIIED